MAGGSVLTILRDYCENSSLTGFAYMANQKIHFTERIFWLLCIILSAGGSYHLIREYQDSFDSNSISLVLEGTRPNDKNQFPAVALCEIVANENQPIIEYVNKLFEKVGANRYYDIDNYLTRVIFPNSYTMGMVDYFCGNYVNCTKDCVACPVNGYKELASLMRLNCSELLIGCTWNGKPFNCCKYFLPLQTPNGLCYIFNSIHTAKRDSPNWFNTDFSWADGKAEMEITLTESSQLVLLNTEDIPTPMVKRLIFPLSNPGVHYFYEIRTQNIINDPGVRAVLPEYRKCRFPDEQTDKIAYDHYSYTTCITHCLKRIQLKLCKCNTFNYIAKSDDKSPSCDFSGFRCLDHADFVRPKPDILKPHGTGAISCKCLPSCDENEIFVYGESIEHVKTKDFIRVTITQAVSTEQFRRQAVRTRLDVVVTIGGILGLFMGASVLSGIEIIYFFFVRIFNMRN